jgi:hypothetical protein
VFDTLLADGLASGAGEKVATFVVKCLAVAGGFLVGYFLGGVVAWALDRWVCAQKAPGPVKKAVSWVAAVALALLVALIVFGDGGNGLFGRGGGTGDGKGTPASTDNSGKAAPVPTPDHKDVPPKKDDQPGPPPPPTPGDVRVTILPDDEVREGRFYLIDGDAAPKNFDEFKSAILARQKEARPEVKQVIFRFRKVGYTQSNPVVRDVVAWLNDAHIGVYFEKTG